MNREHVAIAVVGALLAATAPLAAAGVGPVGTAGQVDPGDGGNQTPPGARLAGVVGMQGAALGGAVANRSLRARLEAAQGPNATGAVVGEQLDRLQTRLENLSERKRRLVEAHQNGSLSTAQFRARIAQLAAQIGAAQSVLNTTTDVASDLSAAVREKHGINVTAIERLSQNARNLAGGQVAEIARSIGGNRSAGGPGNGAPGADGARGEGASPSENANENASSGSPGGEERGNASEPDRDGGGSGPDDAPPEGAAPNGSDGDAANPDQGNASRPA